MTTLAPDRETAAPAQRPPLRNPYPGLRSFMEEESDLFFGREREIATVLALLEQHQLVVVHGTSGCGKSSVVRAGVVPVFRLDALANDAQARVIIIKPADAGGPLRSLARKLEREFPRDARPYAIGEGAGPAREAGARSWSETLAASPDLAHDISEAARAVGATLCLIIDQFEEIFAVNRTGGAAEARRLIEFLVSLDEPAAPGTALGDRPLSVILTMRSDYLGQCALWDGFAEAVNRCQYLLPKLATVGLLRSIHEPARLFGGVVTEEAADRLLPVMAREIDGLPILQHALMRAWSAAEVATDAPIVYPATFELIGGVDHALSCHAEEAFARATHGDPALEDAANWLFRSLSDLDTDGRIIRRSVRLGDLPVETGAEMADIKSVLDVFRAPEFSLVTPYAPEPLEGGCVISVSHEALLRQWSRISDEGFDRGRPKGLIFREVQDGLIARALSVQSEDFASNPARVLNPASTEARVDWFEELRRRPGWIARYPLQRGPDPRRYAREQWGKLASFMDASKANLDFEKARLEAEKVMVARLQRNRRVLIALSTAVIILLSVTVAVLAVDQAYRARQRQRDAQIQELQYRLGKANQNKLNTAYFFARRECAKKGLSVIQCPQSVTDKYLKLYVPEIGNVSPDGIPTLPYSGGIGGVYPLNRQATK